MELTATRLIDAPIDTVWALQLDHEHWPEHLPNFRRVVRHAPDTAFGVGSAASITQPGLGTVDWTVSHFEQMPDRRSFTWTGSAKGAAYEGTHLVEECHGGRTQLTLTIVATGPFITVLGRLVKARMQKAVDDEIVAFERWASDVTQLRQSA